MKNDDWEKVKEIFVNVIKLAPKLRLSYLEEVCANDIDTRREVESLLASHNEAEDFMNTPAVGEVADVIHQAKNFGKGKHFGHYEIIEQIGAGGMGEVYLAQDKKLDRQVAIKILNESFAKHESNLNRFIQEAKAASALNHPNILVIYEVGEDRNTNYIVSEFIKGQTLAGVISEESIKLTEILNISIQIAGALCAAHEAHLVHRDIKPDNVMVRSDGIVKVLDFGLAKLIKQNAVGFEEATIISRSKF